MKYISAFLLFGFVFTTREHSVNYCGAKICQNTNAHTFCKFPPGPSNYCTGYVNAPLTAEEKSKILARLNRRRSEAASGRLRNLPAASNMLKLRWVEELSREAQRWADQCRPPSLPEEKDACRDLYSISVGQCVASVVGEAPGLLVESLVDLWYMQSKSYKWNITSYLEPYPDVTFYGDFAQIMWAHSYMVGCGRSRFTALWRGRIRSVERLVCNFAPRGPQSGKPLWDPGASASACPPRSRPDPQLTTLCAFRVEFDETEDVGSLMSFEEHTVLNTVMEIENNELLNYQGSIDEIYLTKMAVATIDVSDSTVHYNSHQKRDIIETINQESTLKFSIDNLNNTNVTSSSTENNYTKYINSKKANFIGRPKSYNLEELNSIREEELKNVREVSKEKVSDETDLYLDYEFTEIPKDDEVTSTTKTTLTTHNNVTGGDIYNSINVSFQTEGLANKEGDISSTEASFSVIDETIDRINDVNMSELAEAIAFVGINITNGTGKETSMDELLSDPETVRQLQEALDRMENSLASAPGKVRRDLNDFPNDDYENQKIANDLEQVTTPVTANQEVTVKSSNNDSGRGPMLNMVMKYMPYLKEYENLLQNKQSDESVNSGCRLDSFVTAFILSLFLFV